eukprot:1593536-Pleurochrysis_carterae.AAC.2
MKYHSRTSRAFCELQTQTAEIERAAPEPTTHAAAATRCTLAMPRELFVALLRVGAPCECSGCCGTAKEATHRAASLRRTAAPTPGGRTSNVRLLQCVEDRCERKPALLRCDVSKTVEQTQITSKSRRRVCGPPSRLVLDEGADESTGGGKVGDVTASQWGMGAGAGAGTGASVGAGAAAGVGAGVSAGLGVDSLRRARDEEKNSRTRASARAKRGGPPSAQVGKDARMGGKRQESLPAPGRARARRGGGTGRASRESEAAGIEGVRARPSTQERIACMRQRNDAAGVGQKMMRPDEPTN